MFKLKHKVGDLVTISYERDRIGIIIDVQSKRRSDFPYTIQWLVDGKPKGCKINFGHYSQGVVIALEEVCK